MDENIVWWEGISRRNLVISALLGWGCSFIFGFCLWLYWELPPVEALEYHSPPLVTRIYDDRDSLITEIFVQKRVYVSLDKLPPHLVQATLAIEDRKFWYHWGINLWSVLRSVLIDIKEMRAAQGASTITQQLARNLFLTMEKTLPRKIKEAVLAVLIERYYTKEEILEMYFNQIYYGSGAYGVEAASQIYFGKSVDELSIAEAALLAGLPQSPSRYSPFRHPDLALRRRNTVLDAMVDAGYLPRDSAEVYKKMPIVLKTEEKPKGEAPYFVELVKRFVKEMFGGESITGRGLSIYTTLDLPLQRCAEQAISNWLKRLEKRFELTPMEEVIANRGKDSVDVEYLQAAMVAMDPHTGEIKVMIGGRDFWDSQFNRAYSAKRQPGSAFKVFLYTAAIDNGFNPSDLILDAPIVDTINDSLYVPDNYDGKFLGSITLRRAFAKSRNLAAVRLTKRVGPQAVADYARRMGIRSKLDPVLSICLGSSSVSLLEMVNAYGTIANYGLRVNPIFIRRIEDRGGRVLYEATPREERVLSPQVAYIMIDMMKSVFNEGTAVSARWRGFYAPAGGKTGTTNDFTDAWFVGFIPSMVAGVWVGFDTPRTIGEDASGAVCALPIWVQFMKYVVDSVVGVQDFPEPPGIVHKLICEVSGKLATPKCSKTRWEVFIAGNEPTTYCPGEGALIEEGERLRSYRIEDLERGREGEQNELLP